MHVELVVPALFHSAAAAPALELLLARGRRAESQAASLEDWLARAFGLGEGPLPAGALTALACGLEPRGAHWMRADPVHLRADRDRVLLFPSGTFRIAQEEAEPLAAALNAHYAGQFTLHPVRPDAWCLQGGPDMPVGIRPPVELSGCSVDAELPDKRWHAVLNELQMAMYQHPVNTAREARGDPVVNSLWLWGAGRLPAAARCAWQSVSADDPVALGLARLAGVRHRAPGAGAGPWLDRAPEDGRHLVVLDALRAAQGSGEDATPAERVQAMEREWFLPLLLALRSARVGMLTVHVPDAGTTFETDRGDLRRFWRRPRPLAEYGKDHARVMRITLA